VLEVVQTFARREAGEQVANDVPEGLEGTGGGFAQQGLELGEELFDGIEVRGIRRQIEQGGAGGFDSSAHADDLMRGEIVHHDDVAPTQGAGIARNMGQEHK